MNSNHFILDLRKQFDLPSFGWCIAALRQEPLVWESLTDQSQDPSLAKLALENLPNQAKEWTPAALALIALGCPISPVNLRDTEWVALEPELRRLADQAFEQWSGGNSDCGRSLAEVGLVALALRERQVFHGNWRFLADLLANPRPLNRPVIACLVGMIPEWEDFLIVLCQIDPGLGMHAFLCTPTPITDQVLFLDSLLGKLAEEIRYQIVRVLKIIRPELVVTISDDLFIQTSDERTDQQKSLLSSVKPTVIGMNPALFGEIQRLLQSADALTEQNKIGRAIPIYHHALGVNRQIQAYLTAQMAKAYSSNNQNTRQDSADDLIDNPSEDQSAAALQAWETSIYLDPENVEYISEYAWALLDKDRLEAALTALDAVKSDPDLDGHLPDLPFLYWAAQARARWETGDVEQAQDYIKKAIDHDTNPSEDNEKRIILARIAIQVGSFEQAIKFAIQVLFVKPNDPIALSLLGQIQLTQNLADEALNSASLAYSQLPNLDNQRLLIQALEASQEWSAALVEHQDLIEKLDSPAGEDWRSLASCALHAGQPELAISACQQCLSIDEHDGLAVELLGDIARSEGDPESALRYYQQATQFSPDLPTTWMSLAYQYQRLQRPNEMLETLRLGSQASPNSAVLQLALGKTLLTEDSPTLALIPLRQAGFLTFDPSQMKSTDRQNGILRCEVANTLGQTLRGLGYLEEARQTFEQVCQISPKFSSVEPEIAFNYAQTLLELHEIQDALPWLESVISHSENQLAKLIYVRTILGLSPDSEQMEKAIGLLQQILETEVSNLKDVDSTEEINQKSTEFEFNRLKPLERAEAYALLAEALYSIGDLPNSLTAYKNALDSSLVQQPGWSSRLSFGLGRTAMALGQPETAIAAFIEAGKADPNNYMINSSISEAYARIQLTGDAFQAAIRAVRQDSNNPETLIWFVNQCLFLYEHPTGKSLPIYEYAQQAIDRAIAITPDRADLYILSARVQILHGEREKAVIILSRLKDPQAGDVNLNIQCLQQAAEMLRKLGEAQMAAEFLEQALRLVQTNGSSYDLSTLARMHLSLSQTWQEAGNYSAALAEVNETIELDGENVAGYTQRCSIQLVTQELQGAANSLEMALAVSENSWEIHLQLALIRQACGELQAALNHALMAVSNIPTIPDTIGKVDRNQFNGDPSSQNLVTFAFAYWLFAYLAQSMLSNDKAQETLDSSPLSEKWFEYAFLQAELALVQNNVDKAVSAISRVVGEAQHNPHLLALQSRLMGRQEGIGKTSIQLFNSALDQINAIQARNHETDDNRTGEIVSAGNPSQRKLTQTVLDEPFYQIQIERLELAATIQGLVYAAIELKQWPVLTSLCNELVTIEPESPVAHLLQARAIVVGAETQRFCENLKIIRHSPGYTALSEIAHNSFEQALLNTAERIDLNSNTSVHQVTHWRVRGKAVFSPDNESTVAISNYVEQRFAETEIIDPEDQAALIWSLGHSRQIERAQEWAQHSPYHPLVAATFAIALLREEPDRAIMVLQQSLERYANPDMSMLDVQPMLRALIAILSNRPGALLQDLQTGLDAIRSALEIWPDEARWHAIAADLLFALATQDPTLDDHSIETELIKAAQLEPDLAEHHLKLGIFHAERGDIDQALVAIEQATQAEPDLPDPWLFLASMQKETGQLEKAIYSSERALAFATQPLEALLLRSELALLTNNPRGALSRTQTIVNINPDEPEAWFIMAQAFEALEQPEDALKAVEKAIPLSDRPLAMQQLRVRLLYKLYGPQMAIQAIQLQLEGDQLDPVLNSLLADYWLELGETENAVQSARRALQTGQVDLPPTTQSHLHLLIGVHARHSGQLDQAIYHLNEAIHQTPNNMEAYLELGHTHQDRRQINQALEVYQMAVKIAPNDFRPYFQAGLAFKDSKDYLESETMLRRAAHLAPNELNIHRQLAAVVALNLVHNRRIAA